MDEEIKMPVESEMRRPGFIGDAKMKLHNGEEWYISSLPLGKRGKEIKDHIYTYMESASSGDMKRMYDAIGDMAIVAHRILAVNYPAITLDQVDYLVTMTELENFILYIMHGHEAPKIIEGIKKSRESAEEIGTRKNIESTGEVTVQTQIVTGQE